MEHIIVSLVHLHSFLRFVPVSAITMPATGSATFLLLLLFWRAVVEIFHVFHIIVLVHVDTGTLVTTEAVLEADFGETGKLLWLKVCRRAFDDFRLLDIRRFMLLHVFPLAVVSERVRLGHTFR